LRQPPQKLCQRRRLLPIANRIKTRVAAQGAKRNRIRIAQRSEMKLLGPSLLRVELSGVVQNKTGKLQGVLCRSRCPSANLVKNHRGLVFRAGLGGTGVESVIGCATSRRVESIMAQAQRRHQIGEMRD